MSRNCPARCRYWSALSRLAGCLALLGLLGASAAAEVVQPNQVVVKVQSRALLSRNYGSGWCLDDQCDLVVTNYHVATMVGANPSILGVKVTESLSATGETDEGAQPLPTASGPLKLAWVRDISLLTLAEPLARKGMHAVPFYAGQLQPDQKVTALGYPGGKLASIPGKFVEEQGEGLLLFELERDSARGFSGGLIVDEQGRAVGLLFAAAQDRPRFVYAVPVWSLADFVHKTKPPLASKLFAGEVYRPDSHEQADVGVSDAVARSVPAPPQQGFSPNPVLPDSYLLPQQERDSAPIERNDVSPAVLALRRSAQLASRQMNNFVARQTLLPTKGRVWQHEVQMIDGRQRFRPLGGGKDRFELPLAALGPVPGAEWADLVRTIGFDASLALRFEREISIDKQMVKEFQFQARPEDRICGLRVARPFHKTWNGSLACIGLIWTDDQYRILRITQQMSPLPETGLSAYDIVVLYGWWGEKLVPVQMYMASKTTEGKSFASRAKFDGYRVFGASTNIVYSQPQLQARIRGE